MSTMLLNEDGMPSGSENYVSSYISRSQESCNAVFATIISLVRHAALLVRMLVIRLDNEEALKRLIDPFLNV